MTHDSLACECDGSGSVPGIPLESDFNKSESDNILIDDDFNWENFDDNFMGSNDEMKGNTFNLDGDEYETLNCTTISSNDDSTKENDDVRDCELSFSSKSEEIKPKALRMNQLFSWEHHSGPLSLEVIQVSNIILLVFIFFFKWFINMLNTYSGNNLYFSMFFMLSL